MSRSRSPSHRDSCLKNGQRPGKTPDLISQLKPTPAPPATGREAGRPSHAASGKSRLVFLFLSLVKSAVTLS
jgi:hypothetical protein